MCQPASSERPQAVVLKLHNFQDKVPILQGARAARKLLHKQHIISIYKDFLAAIIRKRQAFSAVKNLLRKKGVGFAMIYPAVLRVQYEGVKFFKQPSDVEHFLSSLPVSTPIHQADTSRLEVTE